MTIDNFTSTMSLKSYFSIGNGKTHWTVCRVERCGFD